MYVSEYYSKDRVYSDLFIDNMIYMKQWGGLNRNSLSINVQFPPYFSLYILSIDLFKWVPNIIMGPRRALCPTTLSNYYILVPIKSQ